MALSGSELGEYGYLVDIDEVKSGIDACLDYFRDATLNDLAEFEGLNPSIEHFARILAVALDKRIAAPNVTSLKVVLWENESAWAAYSVKRFKV